MKTHYLFTYAGPVLMIVITLSGLLMLYFLIRKTRRMTRLSEFNLNGLGYILLPGILAFCFALLYNAYALNHAMSAIEIAGDISWSLLAKGIRLSLIVPVYGLIVFIISVVSYFVLKEIILKKSTSIPA